MSRQMIVSFETIREHNQFYISDFQKRKLLQYGKLQNLTAVRCHNHNQGVCQLLAKHLHVNWQLPFCLLPPPPANSFIYRLRRSGVSTFTGHDYYDYIKYYLWLS